MFHPISWINIAFILVKLQQEVRKMMENIHYYWAFKTALRNKNNSCKKINPYYVRFCLTKQMPFGFVNVDGPYKDVKDNAFSINKTTNHQVVVM